jgi:hypothetical protein
MVGSISDFFSIHMRFDKKEKVPPTRSKSHSSPSVGGAPRALAPSHSSFSVTELAALTVELARSSSPSAMGAVAVVAAATATVSVVATAAVAAGVSAAGASAGGGAGGGLFRCQLVSSTDTNCFRRSRYWLYSSTSLWPAP